MQDRQYSIKKNTKMLQESFIAAKQFMALFYKIEAPNPEQYFTLAAAHYTLAQQQGLSSKRCKMHLNSSITLLQNLVLQNLPLQNLTLQNLTLQNSSNSNPYDSNDSSDSSEHASGHCVSLLANCYARRAEIFEVEEKLPQALQDYLKVLGLFDRSSLTMDKLLIAQTAISIADLIVNYGVNSEALNESCAKRSYPNNPSVNNNTTKNPCASLEKPSKLHPPIWYIEKALENLAKLPIEEDEIILTQAYAHQIAAMAVANTDLNQAFEHYRLALEKAFKASNKASCQILGDIYNGLGLLYEEQCKDIVIEKSVNNTMDHAMVYFAIALFFYPCYETQEQENVNQKKENVNQEEGNVNPENCRKNNNENPENSDLDRQGCKEMLDIIYDSIHRALDPYPYPLPLSLIQNLIDALIFVYFCMMEGILPNQELFWLLREKDGLDHFAQHIFWLLTEYQRRESRQGKLAALLENEDRNLTNNIQEHVFSFLARPQKNNVVQIKKSCITPQN